MKIYRGVDSSPQPTSITTTSTTTTTGGGADLLQVSNTDRLSFHGLANNSHYIIQNRIFPHPPPSPSDAIKMSPTTTQTHPATTLTNGLKGVGSSSANSPSHSGLGNGFHTYSPCGDGDMCEWDWSMGSLSLNGMTSSSTEPSMSMSEWFKPATRSTSTSTTSLYHSNANGYVNGGGEDVNGNFKHHPLDAALSLMKQSTKNKSTHRPASLDFCNQNGNQNGMNSVEQNQTNSYPNGLLGHENETGVNGGSEEAFDKSNNQNEDSDNKRARSSSLKTNKTPPGTPGHKKIVRFADCLGLDLVDVKLFLDEIPNVPKSAFNDLQDAIDRREEEFVQKKNKANKLDRTLLPSFHQPVEMGDFFDRVDAQKVLLENCYLLDSHQIKGCVRVKNLDFNKTVFLRFTYDDWESFGEIETTYVPGSCDGFSDRFEFNLSVDSTRTKIGCKFAFACRYECLKQEFWDNNCGRNYVFHCVPSN